MLLTVIVPATFSLLIHLSEPMISVLMRYLELVVFWRVHQLNESVAVPTGMIQCLGLAFIINSKYKVLEFESSASEEAILVMPDATSQSNLKNLDRFYQHIGVHAESWYQYANGPEMGRRLNNGDLCLVIGCDKTTSWGIATLANSTSASRLQFMRVAGSSGDLGPSYTWEHSGTAESPRVGPSRRGPIPNQCLFIRYLAFKLSECAWPGLRDPTGVQIRMESYGSTTLESKQSNTPNPSASRTFSPALSYVLRLIFSDPNCKKTKVLPEPTQDSLEIVAVSYAISVCCDLISLVFPFHQNSFRKGRHYQCTLSIISYNLLEPK